jgi:hypothetical protein
MQPIVLRCVLCFTFDCSSNDTRTKTVHYQNCRIKSKLRYSIEKNVSHISSYTTTNHQTYTLYIYIYIYNHTVFSVIILGKNFNISAIYKTVIITKRQPIFVVIITVKRISSHNENRHYITTISHI